MFLFNFLNVLHEPCPLFFPSDQDNRFNIFIQSSQSLCQHLFLLNHWLFELLLHLIVFQHLLIQLPLQHFHLVLILLPYCHDFISDRYSYRLHLIQILCLILAIKQIRVSLDYDLLKKILPEVFLDQIPYFLRVSLEESHCLEDLVDCHVEEAVLRGLQLLEVLQPRVDLLLGVVELKGLEVETRLHFLQTLV